MTPRILDEQSLLEREQKIIDAAFVIIQREGIENLTIDKVVALVPFSKGTVYKHFLGKEDLILAINNQAVTILLDFFSRTARYSGLPRERMLLLGASYLLYAILHPTFFKINLCSKNPGAMEKCSEENVTKMELLETSLMETISGVFIEAIEEKSLQLPEFMSIEQLCFAHWSSSYGVISLLSEDVEACKGTKGLTVDLELFNNANILFDGLNWSPLTKEMDYRAALMKGLNSVFPEEISHINSLGRELNF